MRIARVSKTYIAKLILCVSFTVIILEGVGRAVGLAPSDILYYHTFFKRDVQQLEEIYGIRFATEIEIVDYPDNEGANHLLDDQTVIRPLKDWRDAIRSFKMIAGVLKHYPQAALKNNLHKIYVLDELIIRGAPAGGTYDVAKKSIYLKNILQENQFVDLKNNYLVTTLHHEISSLLMKHYSFDESVWRSAMGSSFRYANDVDPWYEWMFIHGHTEVDEYSDEESLLVRGLIHQYAETGPENDFNTYAELIFADPTQMKHLIHNYPVVAKKYHVFKQFYLRIDSGFWPIFEKIDSPSKNYL